ncbi:MAG TPA: Hsp20/alpha crystallin family protein, partial [Bradyrhizobium sp.]|nr:Hsp20/alpha crystallin family protein [Bradyrhizobium sp.]
RSLMPFSRNTQMSRWGEDTDPFLQMRREMNRLFDDVFSGFGGLGLPGAFGPALQQMPAAPKIDISETENEIQIKAEMPGIDQNNVEVLLEDDRLIIRGEKKEEREEDDKDRNYHVRERVQGAFSRTLPLPFAPDPNQVKAEFKNGVMTITIPKPQEVKQKQHRIDVQKDTSTPSERTPSEPSVSRAGQPAGATTSSTTSQSQAEQRQKETAAD